MQREQHIEGPPLSDWPNYCDEVQRGMSNVRAMLEASAPMRCREVIDATIADTGLCRGRVVNAIAELIDDHVIRRTGEGGGYLDLVVIEKYRQH